MFPNSASVVALVDRLTEDYELVQIEGPSYRAPTATLRREARDAAAKSKKKTAPLRITMPRYELGSAFCSVFRAALTPALIDDGLLAKTSGK